MRYCFKCLKSEEEVILFDGIYINEPVLVCEACAEKDNILLIKIPSIDQLKDSEKNTRVYQRLKAISSNDFLKKENSLDKEYSSKIISQNNQTNFFTPVKNCYWIVQNQRRKKGLSQAQLAMNIGESETAIKFIERNMFPEGYISLLKKLEQFFQIKLLVSKLPESEKYLLNSTKDSDSQKPKSLLKNLSFKKKDTEKITIADLRDMQKRIDESFNKKTSEEVGREQVEDFGTEKNKGENLTNFKSDNISKPFPDKEVPSIYDLLKKKKEKEKKESEDLLGKDIELVED